MTDNEREQATKVLSEGLKILGSIKKSDDDDAWHTLTGQPSSIIPSFLEWAAIRNLPIEAILTVVAAFGYVHGIREAHCQVAQGLLDWKSNPDAGYNSDSAVSEAEKSIDSRINQATKPDKSASESA